MQQSLLVPLSIVIAGAFIAGAVVFSSGAAPAAPTAATGNAPHQAMGQPEPESEGNLEAMRPVDDTDYIKGDPDAPIKIVEYSDFECPFCQRHHNTLNGLFDEYIATGQVAWVYRQFPLEQLHPVKAQAASVASECVGELGGNDAFWQFADTYFERTLTNNRTNIEVLIPEIVTEIGIDRTAFEKCFNSGRYDEKIAADIQNAFATGGRGTPWSILVAADGTKFPINGAQPASAIKQLINVAKNQ